MSGDEMDHVNFDAPAVLRKWPSLGNERRTDDQLRTQGIANWDAALKKQTAINERVSAEFRAEAFNLFNRVQFSQPNTVCCSSSNASFGVVNSQLNLPRVIQFALRLSF